MPVRLTTKHGPLHDWTITTILGESAFSRSWLVLDECGRPTAIVEAVPKYRLDFDDTRDDAEPRPDLFMGFTYEMRWSRAEALELDGLQFSDREALIDLLVDWNMKARDANIQADLAQRKLVQESAVRGHRNLVTASAFLQQSVEGVFPTPR